MDFFKAYWRMLFLLLLCVGLLGWTFFFGPPPDDYIKWLYRLTLAAMGAILAAHLAEAFDTRKSSQNLQAELTRISRLFPPEQLYAIVEKYRPAKLIGPEAVLEVWYELCAAMTLSYRATNYGDLQAMYGSPISQAALAIQKAKIRAAGFTISKVFMVDDPEEITPCKEVRDQVAIGIDAKWMKRENIPSCAELDSVDFAIFDEKVVLAWKLDEKRQISGARLLDDRQHRDQIERYKKLFTRILAESQPVPSEIGNEITLRQLSLLEARKSISSWPRFSPPFEELNYALDPSSGWLVTYGAHSGSQIYGLLENNRLIGFSILDLQPSLKEHGRAELYIAFSKEHQRRGLGAVLVNYTMAQAGKLGLEVFLRIRKSHPGGSLYQRCGFEYVLAADGSRLEIPAEVDEKEVVFFIMKLPSKR